MSSHGRRPRWVRRLPVSLGLLALLLIAGMVAAWLCLPLLITRGFVAGARGLGGDEAAITIDRADFSGMRARSMTFRLGGLDVELSDASAHYSIGSLMEGRAHEVSVDGLTVTLDFVRPRRGVLPDAIEELTAQFGDGGELVWPIDTLTWRNCQLVLQLPDQTLTLHHSGRVQRRADGFLDLEITATAPDTQLELSGRLRTETMDGELKVDRLSVLPSTWLQVVAALGASPLPAGLAVASDRIEASGTASIREGIPVSFEARVDAPAVSISHGFGGAEIGEFVVSASQAPDGSLRAELSCQVEAAGAGESWRLDRTLLHLSLAEGGLRGRVAHTGFLAHDVAAGRTGLEIECGIPALGGTARARATLTVDALTAAGRTWAPIAAHLEGWTDRLILDVPRIALAEETPLEASSLRIAVTDPLGSSRALTASCDFVATPALASLLPAGWSLNAPNLPHALARLEASAAPAGDGLSFSLDLRTTLDAVQLASGETTFACRPSVVVEADGDLSGVSAQARVDLESLAAAPEDGWPAASAVSLLAEIPRVSFETLSTFATGGPAAEPLGMQITASASGPDQKLQATLGATRDPAKHGWEIRLQASARAGAVTLANARVEGLDAAVSIDSGLIDDSSVWGAIQHMNTRAIADLAAAQTRVEVKGTAAALEYPGGVRLEWLGVSLTKDAAAGLDAPFHATLGVNAGILRAGPEVLEQPALEIHYDGRLAQGTAETRLGALLEGSPITLESRHDMRPGPDGTGFASDGVFTLHPISLTNSDILSRWAPELKGVVTSGTLAASGTLRVDSQGAWDGTAKVGLTRGIVTYPAQELRAEGVFAELDIQSLATWRTAPGQRVGFSSLSINDIVVSDALVRFRAADASVIHVEGAEFRAFDGSVRAEPFSLYFPDPDVALDLSMKDLDAGALVRTFDLFNGSLTGRLQGRLPVGLLAGKPIIGEGFLELQPEHPARLSFDAGGLFTSGLPNKTMLEQINRIPHELIEEGLMNLQLQHFRIDLFRRDRPDRPVEVLLGGVAHTRRADVPIELAVRLNGSMSEVLDFLLQLVLL